MHIIMLRCESSIPIWLGLISVAKVGLIDNLVINLQVLQFEKTEFDQSSAIEMILSLCIQIIDFIQLFYWTQLYLLIVK